MIQPDFKTFVRLARGGNLVPVCDTFTADLLTPVGAHLRIAHKSKYSFLLESVEGGETIARYTFTGANPEEVFHARGTNCTIESGGHTQRLNENPIELLRKLSSRYRPVRVPGLPPLIGGAIGYFAYDMVRLIEQIPASGADELGLDDCVMIRCSARNPSYAPQTRRPFATNAQYQTAQSAARKIKFHTP
jgi:anthranilate synthase component 1